ncbi:MAG TPA: EamA family transporter [Hanamia sp.]|nr:EamA family transporter [Hanamia sp.]
MAKLKRLSINKQYKWIAAGVGFAFLWASAASATKIGLKVAQPLVIAQVRFAIGGIAMLFFAHVLGNQKLPSGRQWKQITIYGLLNITIYLGCYVIAMQQVTAGIGALSIATNPLFISFLSIFFLKKKLNMNVIIALLLGTAGVVCASWPLLKDASISTSGLLLLLFSMLSYSVGAIYFSAKSWTGLDLLVINGWQTLIGGLMLLPFTLMEYRPGHNQFNVTFWGSVLWLAIAVSVFAVQLWLWLLKTNTVKAGLWLFLCPAFGFALAAVTLGDHIGFYTVLGIAMVMIGLFLAERRTRETE